MTPEEKIQIVSTFGKKFKLIEYSINERPLKKKKIGWVRKNIIRYLL